MTPCLPVLNEQNNKKYYLTTNESKNEQNFVETSTKTLLYNVVRITIFVHVQVLFYIFKV